MARVPVVSAMLRSASKVTTTFLSSRSVTPLTVPTRMPAIRTVSPGFSRDTSVKTAEYPLVEPVRYWPKMKNRNAVSTIITTANVTNLISVARHPPLIRASRSGRCCAADRRWDRTAAA